MAESTASFGQLATTSKRFARRLLTIGENRLELLKVEAQEESERLMQAFLLALGVVAFGLLAGITLTAAILVMLWAWSPVAALLILTGLYGAAAVCFWRRCAALLRDRQTLSASLDQLRKDRACLEKVIA
jgi:uncharacterized membrane protein YqjE